ncbi:MAG TPA: DUF362 domain-containing protein [Deltaproteobacteria bacterium]|nr:DUF362 domain-containing protein [Deltaproteobacteria bacterium]
MSARVAIRKCPSYDEALVAERVSEAVELLGGMERFVSPGERILIKPNLLSAKPPEAAVTTHPAVVKAVIELVRRAGAEPLVGDSPGIGSARKIAQRCGVMDACLETGTEFVEFKNLVRVDNPDGAVFKRLEIAGEVLDADGVINLPKLKTHAQMLLTMAVKNVFGCVPGARKPQWHLTAGIDTGRFADMLVDLYRFVAPRLNILDAVVSMEGNGPASGEPRHTGLVMASDDAPALDAVAASLLGVAPRRLALLEAARRRRAGETDLARIEVAGEDPETCRIGGFELPPLVGLNFAERLPPFLEKRLRKALTSRPHIDEGACTLCGVCVSVCPAGVMEKRDAIVIDYDGCIRCYCCQEACPSRAIDTREGWLKRLIPGM